MSQFDTKPIYLAARFVCQFWDHQKLFASMSANTSSSKESISQSSSSSPTGRILDSDQKRIADKISNLPHS